MGFMSVSSAERKIVMSLMAIVLIGFFIPVSLRIQLSLKFLSWSMLNISRAEFRIICVRYFLSVMVRWKRKSP